MAGMSQELFAGLAWRQTIARDLDGFNTALKPTRPKGGRPKGSKPKPDHHEKIVILADQGLKPAEIALPKWGT
jgi:hypothetical protein